MKKSYYILFIFVMALSLVACGGPVKKNELDLEYYVWPKPPEAPRIKFINIVRCDTSIREPSAQEKMFGALSSYCFGKPHDVVVDKRGTAFVTDPIMGSLVKFNLDDKTFEQFKNPVLVMPHGLGYDYKHDLLGVVDIANLSVSIFQLPSGQLKLDLGKTTKLFERPLDVAFDPERKLIYVLDIKKGAILAFDHNGKKIKEIGKPGVGPGGLFAPSQMDVDRHGNIYVAETFNFRFQVFDPDGNSIATVGSHGSLQGQFARPKGIAVDSEDRAYITDAAFGNFQVMDKEGNFYISVGRNGTRFPARFSIPQGIFIDHRDRVFVVDQLNKRIQIFQLYTDKYYEEHSGDAEKEQKPASVEPGIEPVEDESWEIMEEPAPEEMEFEDITLPAEETVDVPEEPVEEVASPENEQSQELSAPQEAPAEEFITEPETAPEQ